MKFSFFIIISLALLALLPAAFSKPLNDGKNLGSFDVASSGNADNAPNRFRRNADLLVTAGSASASLNRFAGTVDAEFSRAARSQTLDKWQVIFRKVKNQASQTKLEEELAAAAASQQTVSPRDFLDEELKNAAVTSALAFHSGSSTEVMPSEEAAMVEAARKSTEEHKKTSLMTAIRIMKLQNISPDIIYSIVQNYQDDPERLLAILTSNKI